MRTLISAMLLSLSPILVGLAQAEDHAAVLKIKVQLNAGAIKVADIWDHAGSKSDMVIGPAPPPGRAVTVEAAQLAYIARLFDVDWRPISGAERSTLERAGRPLTREELAEGLRDSLTAAGASPSATIEFGNFAPVIVPVSAFPLLTVEQMSYDNALERFSANISAASEGMDTQRMRVSGRLIHTVPAVVANRRLSPGDVIAPADVRIAQLPARNLGSSVASETAQVVGQSPKRTVVVGQPISTSDVGPPVLVSKGATVVMVVESPGISIAAQGIALDAGGRDDLIQVMNPLSRAVVEARVAGPGRTVIAPGSSPIVPPKTTPRNPEVAN